MIDKKTGLARDADLDGSELIILAYPSDLLLSPNVL